MGKLDRVVYFSWSGERKIKDEGMNSEDGQLLFGKRRPYGPYPNNLQVDRQRPYPFIFLWATIPMSYGPPSPQK